LDRREELALLPLTAPEVIGLLTSVPEARRTESWWLVLRDGMPIAGNAGGGVALLTELPGMRMIGHLFKTLRLSRVVDALDKLVARQRGWLSRFVPDGTAPRRYP
jgi:hypothetical protein